MRANYVEDERETTMAGHRQLGSEGTKLKLEREGSATCQTLGTIQSQLSYADQFRIVGIQLVSEITETVLQLSWTHPGNGPWVKACCPVEADMLRA